MEVTNGKLQIQIKRKLVTGYGDFTWNSRRSLFGAISLHNKISYHLFTLENIPGKANYEAKLLRKARWHSEYHIAASNEEFFLFKSFLFA